VLYLLQQVIAQEEEASLGEDSLADGIVSDGLNDHNVVDQGNTAEQDAAILSIQSKPEHKTEN
jgi:hypothetical protein